MECRTFLYPLGVMKHLLIACLASLNLILSGQTSKYEFIVQEVNDSLFIPWALRIDNSVWVIQDLDTKFKAPLAPGYHTIVCKNYGKRIVDPEKYTGYIERMYL